MTSARRQAWWVAALGAAVASIAGAVLAPSSWWGVAFVAAVVTGLVLLRAAWCGPPTDRRGRARSCCCRWGRWRRAGRTRSRWHVRASLALVGYGFLALLVVLLVLALREATHPGGTDALHRLWGRAYLEGGRRR